MENFDENSQQYSEIINTLKGLQKVKAPAGFEADLMRKINSGKYEKERSFWEKLLLPSRLIPSAALGLAAVIVFFVLNMNSAPVENPLLMAPRVREDVIATNNNPLTQKEAQVNPQKEKAGKETKQQPQPFFEEGTKSYAETHPGSTDSGVSNLGITFTGEDSQSTMPANPSIVSFGNPITKSGLDFQRRMLTPQERAQLEIMKKRLMDMMKQLSK
jgi:hypothetical protein